MKKGLYLGLERDSSEYRIGGPHGVVKSNCIKRVPRGEQWNAEMVKQLVGVPWDPRGKGQAKGSIDESQAKAGDDEKPPESVEIPEEDEHAGDFPDDDGTGLNFESRQNVEVRKFPLRRADFALHGFTQGCGGCICIQRNLDPVGHSASCHTRMAELLRAGSEQDRRRVERAETRIAEAIFKSAQEELRRVCEAAGKEIERSAREARERDVPQESSQPASAEEGIDMEDTTFLYGDTSPTAPPTSSTPSTSGASSSQAPAPAPGINPQGSQGKRRMEEDDGEYDSPTKPWRIDSLFDT